MHDYLDSVKVIADFLKRNPELKIELGVHTDHRGNAAYNKRLSEYRANALKELLVEEFNIRPERIIPKGYGESAPIYPEKIIQESKADAIRMHAANNRIEIKII